MAFGAGLIIELIADAFIEVIDRSRCGSTERAWAAWRWLQQISEPPTGLELVSPDGARFTGICIIERNRAVLLLALRHSPQPHHSPPQSLHLERSSWNGGNRHASLFSEDETVLDERNPLYWR
jgi:hypothetical protein